MIWFTAVALALEPGTHALDMQVVTQTKVPVLGRLEATTRSWAIVEIRETAGGLVARQTVCDVQTSATAGARTIIPKPFIAALPVSEYPVVVRDDGWVLLDQQPSAMGFDTSVRPTPPTSPDDPSVLDPDGDGHPGGTVHIQIPALGRVDLYVAQLAHTRLLGWPADVGIAGSVEMVAYDSQTLGATHPFFRATRPTRPAEGSRFTLTPAPGASCASWNSDE